MARDNSEVTTEGKKDLQVVNVRFPRETHEKLRLLAFQRRISIAEMVRNATDAWLASQDDGSPTKRGKK